MTKISKNKSDPSKNNSNNAKAWTFPKHSLEDALNIVKAIEEKNAGNPMPPADLAVAVKFHKATDWRFQDLLRSANLYGIAKGTGTKSRISIVQLGQDIVAPSSPHQRTEALRAAFENVDAFKNVAKFYAGKAIPEDEFFLNTLTREFDIPKDRVDVFAVIFKKNLSYISSFVGAQENITDTPLVKTHHTVKIHTFDSPVKEGLSEKPRSREFLDTCFVMMPFGNWEDKYYQSIYGPAIREAGLEPIRADELFHTGSVVEQIWEQIDKAKVLLADLSGRNPNVFYELGLAHASRKPVVFTTSNIDDVPFDLRHLRVITYDFREPYWATALQEGVTDYLRNAMKDPAKSIPQPFRSLYANDQPGLKKAS